MNPSRSLARVIALALACVFTCAAGSALAAEDKPKLNFEDHVKPILREHCYSCHNPDKKKSDLDLTTFRGALAGGAGGEVLRSGEPDSSSLFKLMNHDEEPHMPPKQPKLPQPQLLAVRQWIEGGLLENSGAKAIQGKPAVKLSLNTVTMGRPEGPPPMPAGELRLEPYVTPARRGQVQSLACSPWAPLAAVGGPKQVALYHTDTLELLGVLPFPEGFPQVLRFSRNGRLLLAAGGVGAKAGFAELFDVTTGQRVQRVGQELDAAVAADISADQAHVALGGSSRLVRVYETSTGEVVHTIKKHTDWVTALAYSPDGVLLASGDRAGGLHVWEAQTGQLFYTLDGHRQAVTSLAWSDDSNILASACGEGRVMVWEMNNGTRVRNNTAHGGGVTGLAMAHDGHSATVGRDREVKLWNPGGGQVRSFERFDDLPLHVAITHDNKRVIAGDWTGEVRVWDAATGQRAGVLTPTPPALAVLIPAQEQALAQARAAAEQAAAEQAAAADTLAKSRAAMDELRRRVDGLQVAISDHERDRAAAQKTHQDTMPKVKSASHAVEAAVTQERKLAAALEAATGAKAAAERELQQADALLKQREAEVVAAQAELSAAKAALDAAENAAPRNTPQPASTDAPKDAPKAAPQEAPKDTPKEAPKDAPKETPKEAPKDKPIDPALRHRVKHAQDKLDAARAALDQATKALQAKADRAKAATDAWTQAQAARAAAAQTLASAQQAHQQQVEAARLAAEAQERSAKALAQARADVEAARRSMPGAEKAAADSDKALAQARTRSELAAQGQAQAQQRLDRFKRAQDRLKQESPPQPAIPNPTAKAG